MKKLRSVLLVLFIFLTTMLITSAIASLYVINKKSSVSYSDASLYALFIGITSYLVLGLSSGITEKKKGLVVGLIYGVSTLVLAYTFKLLAYDESLLSIIKPLIYLLTTIIGSIIGVNVAKKKNQLKS